MKNLNKLRLLVYITGFTSGRFKEMAWNLKKILVSFATIGGLLLMVFGFGMMNSVGDLDIQEGYPKIYLLYGAVLFAAGAATMLLGIRHAD